MRRSAPPASARDERLADRAPAVLRLDPGARRRGLPPRGRRGRASRLHGGPGEGLGIVAAQDLALVGELQSLGADRRRHDRHARRGGLENLQSRPASGEERNDGHRGSEPVRPGIAALAGEPDVRTAEPRRGPVAPSGRRSRARAAGRWRAARAARPPRGTIARRPRSAARRGPRRTRRFRSPARSRAGMRVARGRRRSGRRAARPRPPSVRSALGVARGHAGEPGGGAARGRPRERRPGPPANRANQRSERRSGRRRASAARSPSRGCESRSRAGRVARSAAQRDVVGVRDDPARAARRPTISRSRRAAPAERYMRSEYAPPATRLPAAAVTRRKPRGACQICSESTPAGHSASYARSGSERVEGPHPELSCQRRQEMVVPDRESVARRVRRTRKGG